MDKVKGKELKVSYKTQVSHLSHNEKSLKGIPLWGMLTVINNMMTRFELSGIYEPSLMKVNDRSSIHMPSYMSVYIVKYIALGLCAIYLIAFALFTQLFCHLPSW